MQVIGRLEAFYCPPSDENGNFSDEDFGLGNIPPDLLDQATDVLFFLETIEWKWDINTLLQQPAALFNAVLKLMMAGSKLKKQAADQKAPA